MSPGPDQAPVPPVRRGLSAGLLALVAVGVCVLLALGVWQLQRRVWKLDLIERVNERVHAAPAPAPGPAAWPAITPAADEYRHVRVAGRFLNDRETLVQAFTSLGEGYWVLTPLRADQGFTVLVNRGFVPSALRSPAARISTTIRVVRAHHTGSAAADPII